ncbi:hypothetical protein [Spirulina sp. 06S082]|uniref:hypothetical protein n=1 Tax=Spirulina sp. 06S082 TaxID=3110248 RepID=UPI002B2044A1|nr:hypothetical protein [Spirulina sp. 06S082]MEA5472234.1 hypothetical protein [Spirulina sp. 06S082]
MQITAIKQGQMLIFSEMLDIPDGQRVTVEITEVENNGDRNGGQLDFWESIQKFRQENNIEEADIDVDEIFKDVRDKSLGREVIL